MKKILIDSDAGADDLLSIRLATCATNIDISCIIANYGAFDQHESKIRIQKFLSQTSDNNYTIVNGSSKPIKGKFIPPEYSIHGKTFLDKLELSKVFRKKFDQKKLLEIISKNSIDAYVSLGPLTNLSKIITHKTFSAKVKKIIIMGGNLIHQGNYTPFSEVNFYIDPHAVNKVFTTNEEIYLFPLDITNTIQIKESRLRKYFDKKIFNTIFLPYLNHYKNLSTYHLLPPQLNPLRYRGAAIHDCLPIISLIDSKIFKFKKMEIFTDKIVENKGHIYPKLRSNFVSTPKTSKVVNVAIAADESRFWKVFDSLLNLV
jgi:purine nucleosidase